MSPNFALILSAPTWNDPPVKKEKANGTHAKSETTATNPPKNSATNTIPNSSNAKPTKPSKTYATFTAHKNPANPLKTPTSPTAISLLKMVIQLITRSQILLVTIPNFTTANSRNCAMP